MKQRKQTGGKPVLKELADANDPHLNELAEDFNWAVGQRNSALFRRQRLNFDARNCVWPNQSDDGRKWTARRGEDTVFPWPGASDARVPLIDLYINQDISFINVLTARMKTAVAATESNDSKFATTATQFLRWMKHTQMTERRTENRLLANYFFERGAGLMGVFWERRRQLGYEEIDLEQIITRIMAEMQSNPQADRRLQDLPQMLLNPGFDDETVKLAAEFYPDVKPARLKQVVADLRRQGHAKFPRPYLLANRPKLMALAPNEEAFIAPDATSLEDARALHYREIISESKLRDRVNGYNWDPKWVEEMIATRRGQITNAESYANFRTRQGSMLQTQDYEKMFEVLHSYRRLADAEGVPCLYYTCWNPGLVEDAAYHDLLNYDHGELPFVFFEREKRSRRLDDTRGYGEVGATWQNQIKAEWDGRIDRSSIATLPPSHYPPGEAPDKWGPGVQIPAVQPDKYGFFDPPKYDIGSKEVENSVREFADEYFGRSTNEAKQPQNALTRQDLGDTWMEGQKKVDTQIFGLCQQFMPDQFYYRVTGDQKGQTIHATREDIQGKFDVGISLDVGELDTEYAQTKMQNMKELMAMDVNGRIDRDEALTVAAELIDPNLGERLLKPGEQASQQEVEDEQTVFVKLMAGIPVDIKPGQAYNLRLNVLTQLFQQNQMAQQLYQNNPAVKQAFEHRGEQLKLQIDQQQNAVSGRGGPNFAPKTLGAQPAPPQPAGPMMRPPGN